MTRPAGMSPVVVGVDGSEASHRALEWAVVEARRRGAPLRLVHGFPTDPPIAVGHDARIREAAQYVLDTAVERARKATGDATDIQTVAADGSPAKALVDESEHSSLVVVGSRGHGGFTNLLLGSTSVHVAAHAACPVTIVPQHETGTAVAEGPVLVGVDTSPASTPALEFAFERAAQRGAGLVAMHVWHLPHNYGTYPLEMLMIDSGEVEAAAREQLTNTLAPYQERYPRVAVDQRVVQGHVVDALADASQQGVEVVVVGSRGRAAWGGMVLGSASQGVLRHAHRPVVVVQ